MVDALGRRRLRSSSYEIRMRNEDERALLFQLSHRNTHRSPVDLEVEHDI